MIELDVDVQGDQAIRQMIRDLALKTSNLRPALGEVGSMLEASTQQRFLDEKSPEGEDWEKHSDSTIDKRGADANKLQQDNHLFDSINSQVMGGSVAVGVNRVYGRIQHLGGEAGRKDARVTIPARPYLGVDSADRAAMVEIFQDYLGEAVE